MVTFLVVTAIILIGVIIIQIARAGDLLKVIKGEKDGEVSEDTTRSVAFFMLGFMVIGLIASVWTALAYKDKYLPPASSIHGVQLDQMYNLTLFLTGIVFVLTQVLLFWFAFKYRASRNRKAHYYPHNNKLEIVWTVIPSIVLTVLVIFGIKAWITTTGPAPDDAIEIEVIGEQFLWTVRYAGADGKLGRRSFDNVSLDNPLGIDWEDENSKDDFTTTEIHLPVNKPVLFRLAAKDVLHSFYLPHFRVKMDCVPGIPTRFWFTPTQTSAEVQNQMGDADYTFVLACAELCGQAHWNMRRDVIVETEEEYLAWFEQQEPMFKSDKPDRSPGDIQDAPATPQQPGDASLNNQQKLISDQPNASTN